MRSIALCKAAISSSRRRMSSRVARAESVGGTAGTSNLLGERAILAQPQGRGFANPDRLRKHARHDPKFFVSQFLLADGHLDFGEVGPEPPSPMDFDFLTRVI